MGGEGTSTHLHADVLGSYSWSANICGKKTWYFLNPKYTYMLIDVFGRKVAREWFEDDSGKHWQFPLLAFAPRFKVIQDEGEVLFVPSEWYHTVRNERDTISINANWFNRHNLKFIVKRLRRLELLVENERSLTVGQLSDETEHSIIENTNESDQFLRSDQYGKPPFDIEDFLCLLEWKLNKSTCMDLKAIYEVSLSLSHDVLFGTSRRTRSKAIADKCLDLMGY